MLRLLLDEHVSPEVAEGLRRKSKTLTVFSLMEWESGSFLGQNDPEILAKAEAQKLTLVTYDARTTSPVLKAWMESNHNHCGVIFVDSKTIPSSDFGGLVRSLQKLAQEKEKEDWTNRVCFLRR